MNYFAEGDSHFLKFPDSDTTRETALKAPAGKWRVIRTDNSQGITLPGYHQFTYLGDCDPAQKTAQELINSTNLISSWEKFIVVNDQGQTVAQSRRVYSRILVMSEQTKVVC